MPTKKDILLFLKAEIDWHKGDLKKAVSGDDYSYKEAFIDGLEHAHKTIKGLK